MGGHAAPPEQPGFGPAYSPLQNLCQLSTSWRLPITDLREQFPLPLEETRRIAEACGYHHPRNPRTKEDELVTTDIVLTVEESGERYQLPCSIKQSADLGSARTLEKLEIERQWWTRRGYSWVLVTEQEISSVYAENIHHLNNYRTISDRVPFTEQELAPVIDTLLEFVQRPGLTLSRAASACDSVWGLNPGASLAIAYHLLATRRWHIDLRESLEPSRPLELLSHPLPSSNDHADDSLR
jgi:hypothetical protein